MKKADTPKELVNHPLCTGCMACVAACPVEALKKSQDEDGFYRPTINNEICIECKNCINICPVQNPQYPNLKEPKCYAFMADDATRFGSSSGGAFPIIARHFLNKNDKIVGAAWKEDFSVELIIINNIDELSKLQRSKYVQSCTGEIYITVKQELQKGTKILFTGLPCQCAGLQAFLGHEYDNLFIVDILCAQGPSPGLFRRYLEESFGIENLEKYDFRVKDRGWDANIAKACLKDKGIKILTPWKGSEDLWQRLYHPRLMMAQHCEQCAFGKFPRQGDLTIGDFWGISDHSGELNDKKGTSVVFVNNNKGSDLIQILKNHGKCEATPIEWSAKNRLHGNVKAASAKDRFFKLSRNKILKLSHITENIINNKRDIGIVTLWADYNYGGSITAYALYNAVCDLGYDPILIERPIPESANMAQMTFRNFQYPEGTTTGFFSSLWKMKVELNNMCDRFIVGSDQLFVYGHYKSFKKFQQLDWVADFKKKATYATSFGRDFWNGPEIERARLSYYLQKFDYISTREASGVALARDRFGVSADFALDPIFIVDKKHLDTLASLGKPFAPSGGIAAYILDPTEWDKLSILNDVKKRLNLELGIVYDRWAKDDGNKEIFSEDWLSGILNAKLVISDSFHCIAFAILYKIPFLALANSWRGLTRFVSLLDMVGLSDRIIFNFEEYQTCFDKIFDIDWGEVNKRLAPAIESSFEHLKYACEPLEKPKPMSDWDIMSEKNGSIWNTIQSLEERISELEGKMDNIYNHK